MGVNRPNKVGVAEQLACLPSENCSRTALPGLLKTVEAMMAKTCGVEGIERVDGEVHSRPRALSLVYSGVGGRILYTALLSYTARGRSEA